MSAQSSDGSLDVLLGLAHARCRSCNFSKPSDWRRLAKLRFLGKESMPDDSPTLYATDQGSYVVQGWIVTDPASLARLTVPDDETIVEVPTALLGYLALGGLDGAVTNLVPPIVGVTYNGNYIIQGKQVAEVEALSQMSIPEHESVQVAKSAVLTLLRWDRSWSQSRKRRETSSSQRFGTRLCIWRCATCTPRKSSGTDSQPGYGENPWIPRPKPNGGGRGSR
jgi:hypothetical protein